MNLIFQGFLKEAKDISAERKKVLRAAGTGLAVDLPLSIGGSAAGAVLARRFHIRPSVGATIGGLISYPATIAAELHALNKK